MENDYNLQEFESIKAAAAAHARGVATDADVKFLDKCPPYYWRAALVSTKKELEVQLTAYNSRVAIEKQKFDKNGDIEGWQNYIVKELEWKSKATRFLTSIENDLIYVNCKMWNISHENHDIDTRLIERTAGS